MCGRNCGDYLFHSRTFQESVEGGLPIYYGFGARVLLHSGDDSKFGLRVPFGLDFFVAGGRFDIFVEIAPILNLIQETQAQKLKEIFNWEVMETRVRILELFDGMDLISWGGMG